VDPRVGLDEVEKRKFLILPGLELRPLGRPASRYSNYVILRPPRIEPEISIATLRFSTFHILAQYFLKIVLISSCAASGLFP
jgi:hypothetical protein